jgi:hypothetical protein
MRKEGGRLPEVGVREVSEQNPQGGVVADRDRHQGGGCEPSAVPAARSQREHARSEATAYLRRLILLRNEKRGMLFLAQVELEDIDDEISDFTEWYRITFRNDPPTVAAIRQPLLANLDHVEANG